MKGHGNLLDFIRDRFLSGQGERGIDVLCRGEVFHFALDDCVLGFFDFFARMRNFSHSASGSEEARVLSIDLSDFIDPDVDVRNVVTAAFLAVYECDDSGCENLRAAGLKSGAKFTAQELRCAFSVRDYLGLSLKSLVFYAIDFHRDECSDLVCAFMCRPAADQENTETLRDIARHLGGASFSEAIQQTCEIWRSRPDRELKTSDVPFVAEDMLLEKFGNLDFDVGDRLNAQELVGLAVSSYGWSFRLSYAKAIEANLYDYFCGGDAIEARAAVVFHGLDGLEVCASPAATDCKLDELFGVLDLIDAYQKSMYESAKELRPLFQGTPARFKLLHVNLRNTLSNAKSMVKYQIELSPKDSADYRRLMREYEQKDSMIS